MSNNKDGGKRLTTRRTALKAGLTLAALPMAGFSAQLAQAQGAKVTKVHGFETTADIAKAEQEGALLFYTHDSENAGAAVMVEFAKDFPKIKTGYVRAQNGALYSKILAERQAKRFDVDVIQFSEIGTAIDFQKRGGYLNHVSPESGGYKKEYLSSPVGDYFVSGMTFAGIAYNTNLVKKADAPTGWKDLLNPRYRNTISTKQATSGMQFVAWYELRGLYGDDYWKAFAKQLPHGFDSRAQLFDRLAKGDDSICSLAEWAGYVLYHQRNAPIAFVAPKDGLPATPLATGVVNKAPHPEAGKLFVDWLMSNRGQAFYQDNKYFLYGSVRNDAPPMVGGLKLSDFKLLTPKDMTKYLASHDEFTKEWNAMMGL